MKYFRHLFESTATALTAIFAENRHADKVIEYYFKNHKKWGKRDRQFFAETVYGCVRWWNQYLFLSRSETLPLAEATHRAMAVHLVVAGHPLPEWYQDFFSPEEILARRDALTAPHLIYAVPEWLYDWGLRELGEEVWHGSLRALNETAAVVLRANTLKNTPATLLKALEREGVAAEYVDRDRYPVALRLQQRANLFKTTIFQSGGFELQDASSQLVAAALDPQPGERVVDACAGAGGKTLHLAALLQNKGKIISLDVVQWKLDELKRRAKRAGAAIVETRLIESTKVIKRLHDSADALLLDVPCSGLGVLKRNPDSKWKLTANTLEELRHTQREILRSYSQMVKKGGRMVYATCSILPSENAEQVKWFLAQNPSEWSFLREEKVFPHESGFDGFYLAVLRRE